MISLIKYFDRNKILLIFALVFCGVFNLTANGAGELDSSFTASAFGGLNGSVLAVKMQPDGKILVGGQFTEINGFAASGIGRFNVGGSVDTSFKAPDFYSGFGIGAQIFAITLQSDGKILVGGNFFGLDGIYKPGLRRLNADGSLDNSFNIVELTIVSIIYDIEIQSDNKILVAGNFQVAAGSGNIVHLMRLETNGNRDTSFSSNTGNIYDIELQPDGKIIAGGDSSSTTGFLTRLTTTGAVDNTFTAITTNGSSGGGVSAVKIRTDGKILIGGAYTSINGFSQGRISLINTDGSIDLTFNQNNQGANGGISDIIVKGDGKIVIGGGFTTYNNVNRSKIAQLNADGSLDGTFPTNTILDSAFVSDIDFLPDGNIFVGIFAQTGVPSLIQFTSIGFHVASFTPNITRTGRVRKVLQQPDGKIIAVGTFPLANNVRRNCVARFNADGSLDTSFFPFTNDFTTNSICASVALQSDGKILIGTESGFGLRRMNANGSQDLSFSSSLNLPINDIVALPNGQILVGGFFGIRKLNADGSQITAFPVNQPNAQVHKILVQPDGKILIGGDFTQVGTAIRGRIARLEAADGALDNSFNPPGGANNSVLDFDLQADGKVVIGGAFTALNGNSNQVRVGRLNADGSLDTGFAQTVDASVLAVKVEPSGKVLIGGAMSQVQGTSHNGIARLNSNGSVDAAFNTFANTQLWDIVLQTDGKILIGGDFTKINQLSAVRIARLLNPSAAVRTLFDYDGDGKADVSVFRPSENRWYIFRSSDGVISQTAFAITDDKPVPADFDGDGKTDIAIFRSSGDWWSLSSSNNAQITANLGNASDIKLPSDFDGDGRADYIIFRPSNNVWYRLSSATGMSSNITFGLAGDKPVSGDYDGDGKSDVAIYRPSTGDWWYQSSINGAQLATRWGISTDIPTPADFDGDGKTDFAVYRPSTGVWYIYNSSTGNATIMAFGLAEDKPVAADYDGDGKADIAVFRPSTGIWYQMRSTAGFGATQFGISTDIPTPNAFVP